MGTLGYLVFMRKKGEAEIEKGPVGLFPAEPTSQVLCTCEALNPEGLGLPQEEWRKKGEAETEKGPVDLFPAEPTDEAIYREETLNPGFKGPLRLNTKMDRL